MNQELWGGGPQPPRFEPALQMVILRHTPIWDHSSRETTFQVEDSLNNRNLWFLQTSKIPSQQPIA